MVVGGQLLSPGAREESGLWLVWQGQPRGSPKPILAQVGPLFITCWGRRCWLLCWDRVSSSLSCLGTPWPAAPPEDTRDDQSRTLNPPTSRITVPGARDCGERPSDSSPCSVLQLGHWPCVCPTVPFLNHPPVWLL